MPASGHFTFLPAGPGRATSPARSRAYARLKRAPEPQASSTKLTDNLPAPVRELLRAKTRRASRRGFQVVHRAPARIRATRQCTENSDHSPSTRSLGGFRLRGGGSVGPYLAC